MRVSSAVPHRSLARWAGAATALLLAACSSDFMTPLPAPATQTDNPAPASPASVRFWENGATLTWNRITRELVVKYATGAAPAVRIYTLVAVAQDRALTTPNPDRPFPPLPPASGNGNALVDDAAAVGGASVAMLAALYPAEAAYLNATLDQQLSVMAPNRASNIESAVQHGRNVAESVFEHAKTDGYFAPFTGMVPTCPGCWVAVPTPPAFATLGAARTFLVSSGAQFQPPPPPAFGSPRFIADLAEVRHIAATRTAQQDSIAKVWALQNGTVTTLGYWNELGATLAAQFRLNERRAARTLAVMNMAGYDALVSSHRAKYTHWVIRPSQADAAIAIAIGLPSFPAYPSNHATISAAAAEVLASAFPRERARVEADAQAAGISRIYGGIHYRFDMDAGLALGRAIGAFAAKSTRGYGVDEDQGTGILFRTSR